MLLGRREDGFQVIPVSANSNHQHRAESPFDASVPQPNSKKRQVLGPAFTKF